MVELYRGKGMEGRRDIRKRVEEIGDMRKLIGGRWEWEIEARWLMARCL